MIDEQILAWAEQNPEQPALRFPAVTGPQPLEEWTFRELATCVGRQVAAMETLAPTGRPVAITMAAHGNAVAALLAAFRTRRPAVLLPPSATSVERNVTVRLGRAGAILLMTPSGSLEWMATPQAGKNFDFPDDYPEGIAIAQFTSGSTGVSRLALRSGHSIALEVASVASMLGMSATDDVFCASSLSHSYALIGGLLTPLSRGATVCLGATPTDITFLVSSIRPSIVFGLAATYRALLSQPDALMTDSLRWLFSAGAPLPGGLFDEFQTRFGWAIRQDYGTTETGTISLESGTTASPPGGGVVLPHLRVRLEPAIGAYPIGAKVDEVLVRSAAVAAGYLTNAGLLPCVDPAGWFHTRDVGMLDGDGHLLVGRRLREALDFRGHMIHPEAIEELVSGIEGVQECVVVNVTRARGSPGLRVVVAPVGANEAQIRRLVAASLPEPDESIEVVSLDALPRSPAGKILQKYLVKVARCLPTDSF